MVIIPDRRGALAGRLQTSRRSASISALLPKNTPPQVRQHELANMLMKLLRGQKLPQRPFELLSEAERNGVGEQAERFLDWRERQSELDF